ncbi:MAG: hypothetical protein U0V75_19350 [Ferruginibacter sp.]
MVVLLYDESGQISDRLVELAEGSEEMRNFYKATGEFEAIDLVVAHKPGLAILHFRFANTRSAALLQKIKSCSEATRVILLFDLPDEYDNTLFNIHNSDYVLDTYKDFEKIPGLISDICRKTKRTDYT